MRIQKERWYQREKNKEISVLKKETKSLSHILREMQQELDVLMTLVDAQQALERDEQKHCNDDKRKRRATTFIQSCWRRLLARKELQRLKKKAKFFFPLSLLMIQRQIILKREGMIQSEQQQKIRFGL